jgi:hypothetical protein
MALGAAELAVIVGQDRVHWQIELLIERQYVVVQHRHRRLRLLGQVQEAEGIGGVGDRSSNRPPFSMEARSRLC